MHLRMVEVVWDDHAFYGGEDGGQSLCVQHTVGYVVKDTKKVLRLAMSCQTKDKKFYEVLALDKRTIREVREVTHADTPDHAGGPVG